MSFRSTGCWPLSGLTASADTEITGLIPPKSSNYTVLKKVKYRCAGTAHTIRFMRAFAVTTLSAQAAASQAVININADNGAGVSGGPGAIAAGDFLGIELSDGTFHLGKVQSVATLAITLTASLPAIASSSARVWFFGAPADTPVSSLTRKTPLVVGSAVVATVSILNEWGDDDGIAISNNKNEPLMVHSNNATAAGTFEQVSAAYVL